MSVGPSVAGAGTAPPFTVSQPPPSPAQEAVTAPCPPDSPPVSPCRHMFPLGTQGRILSRQTRSLHAPACICQGLQVTRPRTPPPGPLRLTLCPLQPHPTSLCTPTLVCGRHLACPVSPKGGGHPPTPASPLDLSRPRNPPGRPPPRVPHAHYIRLNPCDLCGLSVCCLPPPGHGSVRSGHVCLGPHSCLQGPVHSKDPVTCVKRGRLVRVITAQCQGGGGASEIQSLTAE